ncbi:MAG: hypothetical protein HeimC3_01330 [Candidatus Heimdallarchaeota archaeon LC_3]|nr:MAG: hypothetical protein HeimC3_01330 [Candidatus Heimdallarchaeota archaeon LC_3]
MYSKQNDLTETKKFSNSENFGYKIMGLLRLTVGWIFLWAFLDKLLGLGFATTPEKAWINGGSPSAGYLSFATNPEGPFYWFFTDILAPNSQIIDIALMGMLLFVGVALILGIGVRLASLAGIIFMASIWISAIPLENNPIIDEHIIYVLVLLIFAVINAGRWLGFGKQWSNNTFVQKYPILI